MKPTFTPKINDDAAFFQIPNCTKDEHENLVGFLKERGITVFSSPALLDEFRIHEDITQKVGDDLASEYEESVKEVERKLRIHNRRTE
jgi:hypothetical protein